MRIVAIDPGSKLGWATNQTGRLEWGTENFTIKNGESSGNRWRRFGSWLCEVSLAEHSDPWVEHPSGEDFDEDRIVDLIVYERAVFMPKARAAAEIAGGFTTRLEEHCERHGIALQPVAVSTLKKYATGKGNAGKEAMIEAAKARHFELSKTRLSMAKDQIGALSEHEADALWLYWYAMEHFAKEER